MDGKVDHAATPRQLRIEHPIHLVGDVSSGRAGNQLEVGMIDERLRGPRAGTRVFHPWRHAIDEWNVAVETGVVGAPRQRLDCRAVEPDRLLHYERDAIVYDLCRNA